MAAGSVSPRHYCDVASANSVLVFRAAQCPRPSTGHSTRVTAIRRLPLEGVHARADRIEQQVSVLMVRFGCWGGHRERHNNGGTTERVTEIEMGRGKIVKIWCKLKMTQRICFHSIESQSARLIYWVGGGGFMGGCWQ